MPMQGTAAGDKTVTNTLWPRALVATLDRRPGLPLLGGAPSRNDPRSPSRRVTAPAPAVRFTAEVHADNSGNRRGRLEAVRAPPGRPGPYSDRLAGVL